MFLPLFIENRTCSKVLTSLYISTSIHKNRTGKSYPPSVSLPLIIEIGQIVKAFPPSISPPLFIENRTGKSYPPSISLPLLYFLMIYFKQQQKFDEKIKTEINYGFLNRKLVNGFDH